MISAGIKEDIDLYLQENKYDLQQEVSTPAQYFQIKKGEYSVHMKVIEQDTPIIELNLIVPTEDEASLMCNNWKEKSSDIYSYLMASLLDDKL
jgi:hypothetical protein